MKNKIHIETLSLAGAGDFERFSFKSPGHRLISVTMVCPELFGTKQVGKSMSTELAITANDGDINLANICLSLGQINSNQVREKRTVFLRQDVNFAEEIQGYVKVISDSRYNPATDTDVKIYFVFEQKS
ncbi:hypothetical protein SDC9_200382 [bioreactor metagenome]|uniref:Uncharacterized protein n=1 Tax=bioreactor metagenome TaxID=1076179 RepID=A0A645INN8_9ZZZZ